MATGTSGRELADDEVTRIHRGTSRYLGEVETIFRAAVVNNPLAENPSTDYFHRPPKQLSQRNAVPSVRCIPIAGG
jgi:hypothetical protein